MRLNEVSTFFVVGVFGIALFAGLKVFGGSKADVAALPAIDTENPMASATAVALDSAATVAGAAKVCLVDRDVALRPADTITLPASTVFQDEGKNVGNASDASTWDFEVKQGEIHEAALLTLEPVILRQSEPCAEAKVEMLTGPLWTATSQKASEAHVFAMQDIIDYRAPAERPSVEPGKLIDDLGVAAVITADVANARAMPDEAADDATRATKCLEGAKALVEAAGGSLGEQTSTVVPIVGIAAGEASYGCAMRGHGAPNLFVSWDGQAGPPSPTMAFIAKAGAALTGATQNELKVEVAFCVHDALKPDAGEIAVREVRGVKIDCQAYERDGGGGSVTVYRRFGVETGRN